MRGGRKNGSQRIFARNEDAARGNMSTSTANAVQCARLQGVQLYIVGLLVHQRGS